MTKIAYVMSRFPNLSETFILREMNELEGLGWDIQLYPLIFQQQAVVHADARPWIPRVHSTGFLSVATLRNNWRMFRRKPGVYLSTFLRMIAENWRSPNFLLRSLALFPLAVSFAWQMQVEQVVHIHAHYASHPALVAWIISCLTGIPYSITAHAHDIYARTEMLATKLRQAAFIVAISEFNKEYIANLAGEDVKAKTHVIHCGISPEHYAATARPSVVGDSGPFMILCVGSLKKIKSQIFLAQACKILRDRQIPFHCQMVGMGPEYELIHRYIQENQLEDQIEMLGGKSQDEVARILPEAHCYVQPSLAEGLPVSVMEALACNLPVVATAISGTRAAMSPNEAGYPIRKTEFHELARLLSRVYRNKADSVELIREYSPKLASRVGIHEIIVPGETGYLVQPADALALADAIQAVYQQYDAACAMASNGRKLVLESFDLHQNVRQLAEVFTRTISSV
jgi:colanic acid/amylovoran biosynthesis glycosyltransferase